MKNFFLLVAVGLLVCGFFSVSPAMAQLGGARANLDKALKGNGGTGLSDDLSVTIGLVIKGLLSLVGTIFLLLTIYAGILWMTAQGNEDSVSKAKAIIQAAIIGLIITMAAYAITAFITSKLGGSGGSGSSTLPATSSCVGNCESGGCASGEIPNGTCTAVVNGVCCISDPTAL